MRRGFVIVGLLLGVACSRQPAMTAADARAYTEGALAAIGLRNVTVAPEITPATYGSDEVPVWETRATVDGGTVELSIEREGVYVRFVRDAATGGGSLLTDQQVAALEDFHADPAGDRRAEATRAPATLAALLLLLVVAGALVAAGRGRLTEGS